MSPTQDASSPLPWPPIVFGSAALIAALLTWLTPLPVPQGMGYLALRLLGGFALAAGIALIVAAGGQFRKAGTGIVPTKPTTAIVGAGIYATTRNPMYLGMALILLGLGFATASPWFFIADIFAIPAVTKLAIEREEAYLERKFGGEYLAYKARVRRWL